MSNPNNNSNISEQLNGSIDDEAWGNFEFLKQYQENHVKRYDAKEIIFRESEKVDKVYVILDGMVKLLSYLPNGRARIVRLHRANHWLGLEGVVGKTYEHTAVAIDDVEIAHVPLKNLKSLEEENPQEYLQILKQGYSYLSQADKWIADFSTGDIKPRVARLLEFLSDVEYGESSNLVDLLTVQEMADMLGVTPESVSRILAEFKRKDTLNKIDNTPEETYKIDDDKLQDEANQ